MSEELGKVLLMQVIKESNIHPHCSFLILILLLKMTVHSLSYPLPIRSALQWWLFHFYTLLKSTIHSFSFYSFWVLFSS